MTAIRKPDVVVLTETGPYNSMCGGSSYTYTRSFFQERRVLDNYRYYKEHNLPLPMTNHYLNIVEERNFPGYGDYGTSCPNFCYGGIHSSGGDAQTKATDIATKKFYSRVQDQNNFDLMVSLIEMKKTVALIALTALRFRQCIRGLKHGHFDYAMRALLLSPTKTKLSRLHKIRRSRDKVIERSWLELQYGWQPLMSDIYNSASYVARLLQETNYDLAVKASGTSTSTGTYDTANEHSTSFLRSEVSFSYYLRIRDPLLRASSTLGLTNPLSVAWELVPFSFVVDWFMPIGDILQSISALNGLEIVQSCKATKNYWFSQGYFPGSWLFAPCRKEMTTHYYLRELSAEKPALPRLTFSLLDAVSWPHAASALALLSTTVGRR